MQPQRTSTSAAGALKIPELDQVKTTVVNSLGTAAGQRTYAHAIDAFIKWYCADPRLAFSRAVVLRYRVSLQQQGYASATINHRLAAVRRMADEAADTGLLSADLAAAIRRVQGAGRIGVRLGNWLSARDGRRLLATCDAATLRDIRNRATLALLIGCGLRRGEVLALRCEAIQRRDDHWMIVDLRGKGGHIRTVPVPLWVKAAIDAWTAQAGIRSGVVFRDHPQRCRVGGRHDAESDLGCGPPGPDARV